MVIWLGTVPVLLASTVLEIWQLEGLNRAILVVACGIHIFGVQVPTVRINVPLNNYLQSQHLDKMNESEFLATAELFESRWLRWNTILAVIATLTSVLLLLLLNPL